MGCTSSAPNTIPPNAHKADKRFRPIEEETKENPSIEVDVAAIEGEIRNNETKALPLCDTFEESVQLVRSNKSMTSLATEKDVPANGHVIENVIETHANSHDDVKIPKLELLMNKVFETNHHLNESDHKDNESKNTPNTSDSNNEVESTEKRNEETDTLIKSEPIDKPETEAENKNEEINKETEEASPSQSQSSRATRWEALADIAAELPPSLAVDPVTGQIYQIALTK